MRRSRPLLERFWAKVQRGDGDACWLWTAAASRGYGVISRAGRLEYAHRVAWEIERGPIPPGMNALHRCDVPRCVRVDHLFLGSQTDNMQDAIAKGRLDMGGLSRRGSRHSQAKLHEDDVRCARALHRAGAGIKPLAAVFGVSQRAMQFVVHGTTWRHVS